jgi:hypothetical protein
MKLLCRNKVTDFNTWWAVFESYRETHEAADLFLEHLWQNADDPNEIFFLFSVEDRARAVAFVNVPESEEAGRKADVINGDFYFIEEVETY